LGTCLGLSLEQDLCSAKPLPTLIDRLNFFLENLVEAICSGDRHGSPQLARQLANYRSLLNLGL
jgi:hypothetical protein